MGPQTTQLAFRGGRRSQSIELRLKFVHLANELGDAFQDFLRNSSVGGKLQDLLLRTVRLLRWSWDEMYTPAVDAARAVRRMLLARCIVNQHRNIVRAYVSRHPNHHRCRRRNPPKERPERGFNWDL